jgi:hypothetical protein
MINGHDDHDKAAKQVDGFDAVTGGRYYTTLNENGCAGRSLLHTLVLKFHKSFKG